jgi:hypothetical protein
MVSVSIIIILAVSSLFTLAVSAKGNDDMTKVAEYVETGDTIWSMSESYKGDMEIREYISLVMDVNQMDSACIKPGDLLYFPDYR